MKEGSTYVEFQDKNEIKTIISCLNDRIATLNIMLSETYWVFKLSEQEVLIKQEELERINKIKNKLLEFLK